MLRMGENINGALNLAQSAKEQLPDDPHPPARETTPACRNARALRRAGTGSAREAPYLEESA